MKVIRRAIAGELLSSSSSSLARTSSLFLLIRLQSLAPRKPYFLYSTRAEAASQAPVLTPREVELQKNTGHVTTEEFPRPSEIPWQEKAANWVNLIGLIHEPVQVCASPDGRNYWARTILAEGRGDPTNLDTKIIPFFRIPIVFEGDLARIAASHLKATDYVHVAGLLRADAPPFTVKEGHVDLQVVVHNVNFVQMPSKAKTDFTSDNFEDLGTFATSNGVIETKPEGKTASDPWRDLLLSPENWFDYRVDKLNGSLKPKYPHFKHKSNGTALWLGSAPKWFLPGLNRSKLDVQLPKPTQSKETKGNSIMEAKHGGETESDPWKDLLENPQNWWDYRLRKRNDTLKPKFPDFKHKSQHTVLWVEGAPKWVLQKLDALKLDDDFWEELVANPEKWWDNRTYKVNPKFPDFVHKDTRKALWLNCCPPSLLSSLPRPREQQRRKCITTS